MASIRIWNVLVGGAIWLSLAALGAAQPVIKTIAGGTGGVPMNGVPATSIGMGQNFTDVGSTIAVDAAGNLYATAFYRIYRVDTTGTATILAGTGVPGFSDGGGVALNAQLGIIVAMVVDSNGNLYAADFFNICVWKINIATGQISLGAGVGTFFTLLSNTLGHGVSTGDGGPAAEASLAGVEDLALDHQGNLYMTTGAGIRKVNFATGIISSFPLLDSTVSGALQTDLMSMAIDNTSTYLYLSDLSARAVYQVALCNGAVTSTSVPAGFIAFDAQNNLYSMDLAAAEIYRVPGGTGTAAPLISLNALSTALGTGGVPSGLVVDASNNLYFGYGVIWKSNTSGATPVIYGGDQSTNYNGEGSALTATFSMGYGMAADHNGNVYFSDTLNNRVRKINVASETISTVAGNSIPGASGDQGQATSAELSSPGCLSLDPTGQNLYITDYANRRIRQVVLQSGIISTVVSASNGPSGFEPTCVAVDGMGNLYVIESSDSNYRLDQYNLSSSRLTSFAAPADIFSDTNSFGLVADVSGNVYVSFPGDNTVYRYTNGVPSLFAGTSATQGDSGDGGPATAATLHQPQGLALDGLGNLFIDDSDNYRIRRVQLSSGNIYGLTFDYSGSPSYLELELQQFPINGLPIACATLAIQSIAADGNGNLFLTNTLGDIIMEAANWNAAPATTVSEAVGISPSAVGLGITVDGATVNTSTVQTWNVSSNHTLTAPATQTGQNGYTYSFTGWSDGTLSPSRSITAGACPVTYTALYSEPSCQLSLSAAGVTLDDSDQSGYFMVLAPPFSNCSWTAASNASWLSLVSNGATGTGPVRYLVTENDSNSGRTGIITAAGQQFTVVQEPASACFFVLDSNPTSTYLPAANAASSIFVNAIGECFDNWQASSTASWLHVSGGNTIENGPVTYTADTNTTGAVRTGTIQVTEPTAIGSSFAVTQEPAGVDLVILPTAPPVAANGGSGAIAVTAIDSACVMWTAVSNVPWITIVTPATNAGVGGVTYSVAANNTGSPRQGTMTVAGTTITIDQAAGNCSFSLGSQSSNAPAGGGTGTFALTASDPFCFWSAASNASWLTLTSAATGSGSATVAYAAAADSGGARNGAIAIAGQTFTVTQTSGFAVSFQTAPAGLQVMVDGSPVGSSSVSLSGTHTISVASPQAGAAGTQYVYSSWSDAGAQSHSINVTGPATYTATFQTQYQLTISASPAQAGTVIPASGGYYNAGTSVPINATPNTGYQFANWTGNAVPASVAPSAVTMSAPETVAANFTAVTPITIQTSPAGLQFTVAGGAVQTAPQTVYLPPGPSIIALAATQAGAAGTQYVFTSWSDSNTSNPRPITVGSSPATYTATFQTQYQLTVSASPAAGGSVTPASGTYYNSGSTVAIAATANSGYQFTNWSGSVAGASSASTTVAMSAPETVVANFSSLTGITIQTNPPGLQFTLDGGAAQVAPQTFNLSPGPHTVAVAGPQAGPAGTQFAFASWSDGGAASHSITVGSSAATYTATFTTQYQLTISASPAAGGTVSPVSGAYYNAGASVPVAATANSGYQFVNWTGAVANASSASTTIAMSAPETVAANFATALSGITIQTTPAGLQFTIDGGAPQSAPQTLSLSQGSHTISVVTTQAGSLGTQYTFLAWSDGGQPSHTITVGTSAATYTATFQTQYLLTLSASPAAAGTVTPATGTFYSAGASVPIAATANSGYQFAGWTGAVASSGSAFTTITMSAPEIAAANFTAVNTSGLAFFPVAPCRVVDTRNANGAFGGPILAPGSTRSFAVPASACNIPAAAQAYSLNITVVPAGPLGYLTAWPTGQPQPYVSTLNSSNGAVIANAAIVPAGTGGAISIYVSDATHVIIDINGYFAAPTPFAGLAFYPVTPCRIADTRNPNGAFGGPSLSAGATRNFTVPSSSCGIPTTAQAYSLNMTVVPPGPLDYLTAWPTGQTQPYVSTLNALQGQVAANAAIVPAGSNGAISVFVSDPSNVIVDINGYFGPPGSAGALYFYPVSPCRVADTRNGNGTFGGPSLGAGATRSFPIPSSACGIPAAAQAYSLNMTVVPASQLFYLSTWPTGQAQPVVSTLNDLQGQVVANAAIVPAGGSAVAGAISVFVSDATNLIVDINGYFGQ